MPIWLFPRGTPPSTAPNERLYAVGDIHGRLDLLDRKLEEIFADIRQHPHPNIRFVFLGDYVDRGPQSAQVLDRLVEFSAAHDAVLLKGNHEALVQRILDDADGMLDWAQWGGIETLLSYGITLRARPTAADSQELTAEFADAVPSAHRRLLARLTLTHHSGDYLFVHAGLRPRLAVAAQNPDDLLWIRDEFLAYKRPFEKFVVHGHTPVLQPDVRNNRINIDTGAYATGRLTCLVLEDTERRLL